MSHDPGSLWLHRSNDELLLWQSRCRLRTSLFPHTAAHQHHPCLRSLYATCVTLIYWWQGQGHVESIHTLTTLASLLLAYNLSLCRRNPNPFRHSAPIPVPDQSSDHSTIEDNGLSISNWNTKPCQDHPFKVGHLPSLPTYWRPIQDEGLLNTIPAILFSHRNHHRNHQLSSHLRHKVLRRLLNGRLVPLAWDMDQVRRHDHMPNHLLSRLKSWAQVYTTFNQASQSTGKLGEPSSIILRSRLGRIDGLEYKNEPAGSDTGNGQDNTIWTVTR